MIMRMRMRMMMMMTILMMADDRDDGDGNCSGGLVDLIPMNVIVQGVWLIWYQ